MSQNATKPPLTAETPEAICQLQDKLRREADDQIAALMRKREELCALEHPINVLNDRIKIEIQMLARAKEQRAFVAKEDADLGASMQKNGIGHEGFNGDFRMLADNLFPGYLIHARALVEFDKWIPLKEAEIANLKAERDALANSRGLQRLIPKD